VVSVRAERRRDRAELEEAQSQRSQAEERVREAEGRAKEAEELKAALAAKAAVVVAAEEQLRLERAPARRPRVSSSRSGPPSSIPGWRSSGSMLHSRGCRRC
jgi:hypothetical protein